MNTEDHKYNKIELDAFDGERGLPSVNENRSNTWKRSVIIVFVLGGILATAVFAYTSYYKSQRQKKEENTQKEMQVTHAVPARTFELETPAIEDKVEGIESQNQPNQQITPDQLNADSETMLSSTIIDKTSGELMVKNDLNQSAEKGVASGNAASNQATGALDGLLNATPTPLRAASVLKNRNYVLAKGSFIDCVLQTKLDTTVPGMTSCVVTRNIYSDTGKVLLIERGSTVSGEYQSNMKQGQARIFVLWTRIKTPNGVIISLDSPGTDSLGGSGLPGYIDNHFWQRFGGAIMLSFVQDISAAAANQIDKNGTTITLNNSSDAAQTLATEALRNTINIPPTLYKNQGDRVGIYVARDLDFKSVYDLKPE